MNLVQEKPVNENNQKKLKAILIAVIILICLLIGVAIFLYFYTLKIAGNQLKVEVDGISNTNFEINTFLITDGKVYTAISDDLVKAIGYTVYPGEYKEYTESKNSCYATNTNELVTFSANSNVIRKYPLLSDSEAQDFKIDEPVSERNGKLYVSQAGLERAFNLKIAYNKTDNKISIMTLSYITAQYESAYPQVSITNSGFSNSIVFNNEKALLNNLAVIKDTSSNIALYGVALYNNNILSNIITPRYTSVEYIEGIEDFIVKTEDNKYGIIGKDGITKVKPSYDEISEIDKNYGLYLVTSNGKQGVVNQNGKIIVYQDYEQIGLDRQNQDNNVKNRYLLLNNCIPVKQNNKWGLIDKEGNQITSLEYDAIGCSTSTGNSNSVGVTIIPDMDGIVVGKEFTENKNKYMKYGIVNSSGKLIVDITSDAAFAVTLENNTKYYLSVNNQNIDIVDYWNKYNNKSNSSEENNNTSNEISNENLNEISNENSNESANIEPVENTTNSENSESETPASESE